MPNVLVPMQERRAIRRAISLDCQVVRTKDFRLVGRRAVDLSTRGMLVLAEERVLTGEELVVSFRAPRSTPWVDCEAVVARVDHARRPTDNRGRALGIAFDGLDARSRLAIASLHGVPPPVPRRARRIDYAASVSGIAWR